METRGLTTRIVWERLDVAGHDACRLRPVEDGWELGGTAIFVDPSGPARIDYLVRCRPNWRCRSATVQGWLAERDWHLEIALSDDGDWSVNGESYGPLRGCVDVDFGFTPSTNLLHLRRRQLRVGDADDIPVAWSDLPQASLSFLPQRYERRSEQTYWYESPTADYSALLKMAPSGFVVEYPGLWQLRSEVSS